MFDNIIKEYDENVINSLLDYAHKIRCLKENASDEFMEEFVGETFDVIMEMASKDKDEITKWMDKNGYWNTKDVHQKKQTNRMYQFLKQHKFDPKDETYETDIKLKNGKNKRIKLKIDKIAYENADEFFEKKTGMSFEEFFNKYYDKDKKEWKESDDPEIKSLINDFWSCDTPDDCRDIIKNEIDTFANEVKSGRNAFYDNEADAISLSSKHIKGKQIVSQQMLKHEEGHANDNHQHGRFSEDKDAPEAAKFRDDYIASGKYVEPTHDANTSELIADEYSAKYAKKRTKNFGKNNKKGGGTNIFTKSEIYAHFDEIFKIIDNEITKSGNSQKESSKRMGSYFASARSEELERIKSFDKIRYVDIINKYKSKPEKYNTNDPTNVLKFIDNCKDSVVGYSDIFNSENINNARAYNVNRNNKNMAKCRRELDRLKDELKKVPNDKEAKEIVDKNEKIYDKFKTIEEKYKKSVENIKKNNETLLMKEYTQLFKQFITCLKNKEESKIPSLFSNSAQKCYNIINNIKNDKINEEIKEIEKDLAEAKKMYRESTDLRAKYATRNIQEYFTDLFEEYGYISLE